MPNGIPRRRVKHSLADKIDEDLNSHLKLNQLSTDSLNLLNLLMLIVDIEYRRKYGGSIDWQKGRGYSKKHNEVLADQLPPTDGVKSARLASAGDNWA